MDEQAVAEQSPVFAWDGVRVPAKLNAGDWGYGQLRELQRAMGPRADLGLDREDTQAAIIIVSVVDVFPLLTIPDVFARLTVAEFRRCIAEMTASMPTPPTPVAEPAPEVVLSPTPADGSDALSSADPVSVPA